MSQVKSYPHLADAVQSAAALPDNERCRLIRQDRWIGYGRAKQALQELENLFDYPQRDRMPNMLLFGPTNNGKTKIIRRFTSLHQPSSKPVDGLRETPVVMVEMSPQPGLARLYGSLLDAVGAPYRKTSRHDSLEPLALSILRQIKTKVIIIDEVHNLLACNVLQQRQVLNQLKFLGNQLKIPLVGVGTEEAWSAVKSDPQMANRFEPFHLPGWGEGTELLQLMMTFGQLLPLRKPSQLAQERFAKQVLHQSYGTIGSITRLMEKAAVAAIISGEETINLRTLSTLEAPAFGIMA